MLPPTGTSESEMVRGWMFHGSDPAYHQLVLRKAKEYGINHLEISGSNPTTSDEMVGAPGALVAHTASQAKAMGINAYIWVRELNTREKSISMDPATPTGAAFWTTRLGALRAAFEAAPDLAGIVMSYASTPTEIWQINDPSPFWQGKSMEERIRFVTDQFKTVSLPLGKRVYTRDFNHSPQQLKWLVGAYKDFPGITVHSKWTPQDWQLFYPQSFAIGAVGQTPQVIEADLGAEYWGRSLFPVSLVRYIKYRWDYDRAHGCRGIVARVDRDDLSAFDTPSEINLFALSRYLASPKIQPEQVYREWNERRYGLGQGSDASNTLTRIYERTFDQARLQYYTLGFWTPKSQTEIPDTVRSIEGSVVGKSSALWDSKLIPQQERLMHPDWRTLRSILRDRDRAVRLAELNQKDLRSVAVSMKASDAKDWEARLELSAKMAKVWRAMGHAVWRLRVAEEAKDASAPTQSEIHGLTTVFVAQAQTLIGNGPGAALRLDMATSANQLAADIERRALALADAGRSRSLRPLLSGPAF